MNSEELRQKLIENLKSQLREDLLRERKDWRKLRDAFVEVGSPPIVNLQNQFRDS